VFRLVAVRVVMMMLLWTRGSPAERRHSAG
jgi:hypothetical protein